jgi:hypothetical protein
VRRGWTKHVSISYEYYGKVYIRYDISYFIIIIIIILYRKNNFLEAQFLAIKGES